MRVGSAPVGEFVVGDIEWVTHGDVLLPPPSLDELVRSGGGVLSAAVWLDYGTQSVQLPVTAGSGKVTVEDDKSPTRAFSATIHLPDGFDVPRLRAAFAAPLARIRVEASITDPMSGKTWPYPLASVAPQPPQVGNGPDGLTISVRCPDVSVAAKRALMRAPYTVGTSTLVTTVVRDLLSRHVPWLPVDLTLGLGYAAPALLGGWGADPWQVCRDVVKAAGADLRVDGDGVARLHWVSAASTAPAVTWTIGPGGGLSDASLSPDADPTPSACLVEWGLDANHLVIPRSAPVGVDTITFDGDASILTDETQAARAAEAALIRARARQDSVDVTVPVDYRRDVGDVVRVLDPESGLDYTGRIVGLTWALEESMMTCSIARERAA